MLLATLAGFLVVVVDLAAWDRSELQALLKALCQVQDAISESVNSLLTTHGEDMSTQLIGIPMELQIIKQEVLAAVGETADSTMFVSVLNALCQLMNESSSANPSGQIFRLLQGFYLAGKLSEDQLYGFAEKFGQIQLRLNNISEA